MKILPILIIFFTLSPIKNQAAIFTVTNINDSGANSFREALILSNANGVPDEIHFNIAGSGPHIINLLSHLPIITDDNTIIDAKTQPGWSLGNIVVDCGSLFEGLIVLGFDTEIKGLHFTNCQTAGILIESASLFLIEECLINNIFLPMELGVSAGIHVFASFGGTISNCYIGVNSLGSMDLSGAGENGIYLNLASNILVQNNVVSGFNGGSSDHGIYLRSADSNTLLNNKIGTDFTGTSAIPNSVGIFLEGNSNSNQITGNVIGGNVSEGIFISN